MRCRPTISTPIDANGNLTIITSNDYASTTLGSALSGGAIGGTLTGTLTFTAPQPPIQDPVAQEARANLVSQYINILAQIDTTSQDSSFIGINLLNGDTLKLVFNETGKSSLNITSVTYNSAGLGLSSCCADPRLKSSNMSRGASALPHFYVFSAFSHQSASPKARRPAGATINDLFTVSFKPTLTLL